MKNNFINISIKEFKYLEFEVEKGEHIVALVDKEGYKIIKGYGNSIIEAINDLHSSII